MGGKGGIDLNANRGVSPIRDKARGGRAVRSIDLKVPRHSRPGKMRLSIAKPVYLAAKNLAT